MKKIGLIIALLLLASSVANANALGGVIGNIQDQLDSSIAVFYGPIKAAAQYIFYALAIIDMVIVFGLAAVRNELEIGGIFAKLIQMMLLLLLFKAFFINPDWMKNIYNGFNALADKANGGTTPSLDAVMDNVGKFWGHLWEKVDDNGWRGLGDSILLLIFAVITTIFISLMVGRALQYYIFFLFSLYVGVFWLGFGSFAFTRQWAFNAIINITKQGAKWMTMMLVVGVTFTLINNSLANGINNPINLLILGITSIIMWGFSLGIDGWVDSYFTGHGGGENNYLGGKMASTAQSAASGAIGGGAAAISQVKMAAAASMPESSKGGNSSSGSMASSSQTSEQSGKGTSKLGNFMNSAKKAAATTARYGGAMAAGAAMGATSGAIKGAIGSNSRAGQKSGKLAGVAFAASTDTNADAYDKEDQSDTGDNLEGSISDGGSSNYISGVPGENDEA